LPAIRFGMELLFHTTLKADKFRLTR